MEIFDELIKKAKNSISFHTPGHSGDHTYDINANLDITELSFSDNMLDPSDSILIAEKFIAKAYNGEVAKLFTNGATACIHCAIFALKESPFLVLGETHKSVFNILSILKAKAYYKRTLDNLEETVQKFDIKNIIITSPNYFGEVTDLARLAQIRDKYQLNLIIDASHGSHFAFCDKLPVSATVYGDIVIHSLHKTLPCYTATAVIIAKEKYDEKLTFARQLMHTSSPFYPSILRAYSAVKEFSEKRDLYEKVFVEIGAFVKKLNINFEVIKTDDITRVVIKSKIAVDEVTAILEGGSIYVEMTYQDLIVLIVTPYNYDKLNLVAEVLNSIVGKMLVENFALPIFSDQVTELKYFDEIDFVEIEKAEGRILAKEIGFYPPGVPMWFAGEILEDKKIKNIIDNKNSLFGLVNSRVVVVK